MNIIRNKSHSDGHWITPCKVICRNCKDVFLIEYTYSDLDGEPFKYICMECLEDYEVYTDDGGDLDLTNWLDMVVEINYNNQ